MDQIRSLCGKKKESFFAQNNVFHPEMIIYLKSRKAYFKISTKSTWELFFIFIDEKCKLVGNFLNLLGINAC